MSPETMEDPRFSTKDIVRLTAAVAGISRKVWTAVQDPAATEEASTVMKTKHFDILPIDDGSSVSAYFHTRTWNDYTTVTRANISDSDLIPFDTDVREVIKRFAEESRLFYFLHDDTTIIGLISVVNINRRQVKVWLFNLLSEVEMLLGSLLSKHFDDAEIEAITLKSSTDKKHEEIKKQLKSDRNKGLDLPIVEYLYFSDLVNVTISKELYKQLSFTQTQFKRTLGSLIELRNTVTHPARSLVREAHSAHKLYKRVQRMEDVLNKLRLSINKS